MGPEKKATPLDARKNKGEEGPRKEWWGSIENERGKEPGGALEAWGAGGMAPRLWG